MVFRFLPLRLKNTIRCNSNYRPTSGNTPQEQCRRSSGSLWKFFKKPPASEVLTCHLRHNKFPPWTSYFVKYKDIRNDQRGRSHFNWTIKGDSNEDHNYHILRTGCYPYIKYHCTKRPYDKNLSIDDAFFRVIKVMNLGIPCLAYGIAATYLIKHQEIVPTPHGPITIYFLYEESKGSMF